MNTGRPTKLTKVLTDKVCEAVRAGNYLHVASAYAGISKDTFYRWLKKGGREKTGIYKDFSDAIKKAMAEAEINDLYKISDAADKGNWQAAAWKLERRFPERWQRKSALK